MTSVKQWGTAVLATAITAVTAFAAPPAFAAGTPPVPASAITNDPNASNGTVAFFNASGVRVTSGTNLDHMFDYAYASTAATRDHSTKATMYLSFPDHTQSDSQNWVQQNASASTNYPNNASATPASVKGLPNPLVTLAQADADYNADATGVTLDTTAGYAGFVQVRVYDSGPSVPITPPFWASDIYVDTTAGTWTQVYPSTTLGAPTQAVAKAGPGSATVSYTPPTGNGGSAITGYDVQYALNNDGPWTSASATFHTSTATSHVVTGLTNGKVYYFRVAAINADGTGPYSAVSNPVTPKADATSLTITKSVTVTSGKTTTIRGTLTDTTTKKTIGAGVVTLYLRHTTTAAWAKNVSVKSNSSGVVAATVKPSSKTYFQWRFAATTAHAAATSPTETVSVKQTVSIHATPARIMHGKTLKVWGGISPAASGRKITLQRKLGKRYVNGASTTIKRQKLPNGKTAVGFVITVKLTAKGSYVYRVAVAGTTALIGTTSSLITVKAV